MEQLKRNKSVCDCGQPIAHARVGLCSICYKEKRKQDWKLREAERLAADSDRHESRKAYFRQMYSSTYREKRLVNKMCKCGEPALKGSRYSLCKMCSKEHKLKHKFEYQYNRKSTHMPTKIRERIKGRLRAALATKSKRKNKSIVEYLGCSVSFYMNYIESQFYSDSVGITMSWENYGKWHIDHIIRIASASSEEQLLKLFHYTNTQPLWKEEHVNKTAIENGSKMSSEIGQHS